ncbi:MAG: VCBS repeat-containing protein, partial [Deltaproteobacteria bacterium]|nr:VCBS repeat-containing protein [Deltaproteobacteria bacterium]
MRTPGLLGAAAVLVLVAGSAVRAEPAPSPPQELLSERSYAIAEYENEEFGKAAAHFEKCVQLAPRSVVDLINLAVAAVQGHDHDKAIAALRKARELDPSYPQIPYLLGIVDLRIDDLASARTEFDKLLAADPLCAPARYNLGVVLKKLRRDEDAIAQWTETVRLDPNYGAAHFQLFNMYNARGAREQAQAAFREYTRIKQANLGPGTRSTDVEKSRYFALIAETLAPHAAGEPRIDVELRDVTKEVGLAGAPGAAAAALADVDDDGDLDLLLGRVLYRNDGGHFADASKNAGLGGDASWSCTDFGDFDNDGKLDLVAGAAAALSLYRGRGDGAFEDVSEPAGVSKIAGAAGCAQVRFVDLDHEGDLDIVMGAAAGKHVAMVLRNNGNATFTDISAATTIGAHKSAVAAIALADFDGKNDIDVLIADAAGAHGLYMNLRDGTFRERAAAAGLRTARATASALSGDLSGDGLADVVFLGGTGRPAEVWLSAGDARFTKDAGSPVLARVTEKLGPHAGALVDLDNDGALDLVVAGGAGEKGMAVFRNDGAGGWSDATAAMISGPPVDKEAAVVLAGDLDNDGDQDLVIVSP